MRRGTTPTVDLYIDEDLSGCEIYVTFSHRGKQITKRESEIEAEFSGGATTLHVTLTQAETLSFNADNGAYVEIQVRYKRGERTCATDIQRVPVKRVLLEGAI